jgi:hypothetical protein
MNESERKLFHSDHFSTPVKDDENLFSWSGKEQLPFHRSKSMTLDDAQSVVPEANKTMNIYQRLLGKKSSSAIKEVEGFVEEDSKIPVSVFNVREKFLSFMSGESEMVKICVHSSRLRPS